jgi:hypothetical protein
LFSQKISTKNRRIEKRKANPPDPKKKPISCKTKDELEEECRSNHTLVCEQKGDIDKLMKINKLLKVK